MKVGDVFHIWKGGNWKRYKCYVLAVVDENYIVYKWYGKHKQWWHYDVEHITFLNKQIMYCKEGK